MKIILRLSRRANAAEGLAGKTNINPISINNGNNVYGALVKGLAEMQRQCLDYVVLALYESKPSQNAAGRWLTSKDTNYYPFEILCEDEKKMILDGKHYTRIALVTADVGGLVKYDGDGVEVYHRTHTVPFLSKLKPESNLNYVTEGGVHTGEALRQFAEESARNGWTKESIEKRIEVGMQEYHEKTRELMRKIGVYDALEKMEQRKLTPFEQVLANEHSR